MALYDLYVRYSEIEAKSGIPWIKLFASISVVAVVFRSLRRGLCIIKLFIEVIIKTKTLNNSCIVN